MADSTEADVPKWVRHPLFKGLVVTSLILGALSPVLLKVRWHAWGGDVSWRFFALCCVTPSAVHQDVLNFRLSMSFFFFSSLMFPGIFQALDEVFARRLIRKRERIFIRQFAPSTVASWTKEGHDIFFV